MDSNLLKEAIADAKAVRATALANAKVALEEAFAPRFNAMFADKLKEEAGQVDVASGTVPPVSQGTLEEEAVTESEIDELIKELENEVGDEPAPDAGAGAPPMDASLGSEPAPDAGAGAGVGAPIPAGVPVIIQPVDQAGAGSPVPPAPDAGAGAPPMGGSASPEGDEEVDLNELLESLKEESNEEDEKMIKENVPVKSSGIAPGNNKQPSADTSKSSHISDSKTSVKSADSYPEGGKKIVDDPEKVKTSKENFGGNQNLLDKTAKFAANESVETGVPGGEVTAKEPTDADRPNQADHATKTDMSTPGLKGLKEENEQLKNKLNEAYETVTYIKGQLNEINLLNAKLLYTNKLLKEFTMSNEQKMRVVEMFDLSKNVREVKLTYATIAESLNFSGTMKKKASAPTSVQSITEGIASKPVGSTKPSKEIISESRSAMVSQFQKLAGIKKK